jgi:hypothetical protein
VNEIGRCLNTALGFSDCRPTALRLNPLTVA